MNTVRELRRAVEDATDDLTNQYGRNTPFCEMLHQELGLPQTPREDAEEVVEKAREKDIDVEVGNIKLTVEHEDLHEALRRFVVDSMTQGMGADQMAAQMLIIGRRFGMREAASLLDQDEGLGGAYDGPGSL